MKLNFHINPQNILLYVIIKYNKLGERKRGREKPFHLKEYISMKIRLLKLINWIIGTECLFTK